MGNTTGDTRMDTPLKRDWWPAPCKINRFLHITGRREDDYHTLQTLFQFLAYGDELAFEVQTNDDIRRAADLPNVPEAVDLCLRAAQLLRQATGCRRGVRIHLKKNSPLGAGLGGGSSDAATTLLALNTLWDIHADRQELMRWGLQLGADVPVFIYGQSAWAEGVGEILSPAQAPEEDILVIVPKIHVSTAEIFRDKSLTHYSPRIKIRNLVLSDTRNDLEAIVERRYVEVRETLDWLKKFGKPRMTGSGAGIFLPVANKVQGEMILAQHPEPDKITGFVTRTVNRHPLYRG